MADKSRATVFAKLILLEKRWSGTLRTMSKHNRNLKAEERRIQRLVTTESIVRTRLVEMRLDALEPVGVLDRLTCRPPTLMAGRSKLSSLVVPFRKQP